MQHKKKVIKAVGLLSGGLDSILAAKVIKDQGIEVYAVYFAMPWGCCDKTKAMEAAQHLKIPFITLQLDERYLEIVRAPQFGYGTAINPCIDCRIHMFSRAAQYMAHIGAEFVFTGEVLGQRPMSQMRQNLRRIESHAGLQGRLLRPLSARLLEPTIPEQRGWVDREKLLNLSGRSRKLQIQLANQFHITDFNQPAGGCLLTDKNFAQRMRDTLDHGYRNFRETVALKWGRHFRINDRFKAIIGRDEQENEGLLRFAHRDDHLMILAEGEGPLLVLKGYDPTEEILSIAAGLVVHFSRFRHERGRKVKYWPVADRNNIRYWEAPQIENSFIEKIHI